MGRDGGHSDEIGVPKPGVAFVEYKDEWEDQEEEEYYGYYDALGHSFEDSCARFELKPPYTVEEMIERFVRYQYQADMYNRAEFTVRVLLTNVQCKRDELTGSVTAWLQHVKQHRKRFVTTVLHVRVSLRLWQRLIMLR